MEVNKEKKEFLPSLNGIRALCIFLVIGSHADRSINFPEILKPYWKFLFNGGLGVNIFFVLSGYLITYLLIKEEAKNETISLGGFYKRRFIRILPIYITLLIVFAILQFFGIFYFEPCAWLTSLTFTKNYGCGYWVDGHLWSLSVEEQFYILWPIIFRFSGKKLRKYIAVSFLIVCPIIRVYYYRLNQNGLYSFSFQSNADCLMWGCIGALYLKEIIDYLKNINQRVLRLGIVIVILLLWQLQNLFLLGWFTVPFFKTFVSICSVLAFISYTNFKDGNSFKILNTRFLNYIGILSYSIYVWQQLFFAPELGIFHLLPFSFIAIFIVAFLSYNLVEKPFLKLKNKLG